MFHPFTHYTIHQYQHHSTTPQYTYTKITPPLHNTYPYQVPNHFRVTRSTSSTATQYTHTNTFYFLNHSTIQSSPLTPIPKPQTTSQTITAPHKPLHNPILLILPPHHNHHTSLPICFQATSERFGQHPTPQSTHPVYTLHGDVCCGSHGVLPSPRHGLDEVEGVALELDMLCPLVLQDWLLHQHCHGEAWEAVLAWDGVSLITFPLHLSLCLSVCLSFSVIVCVCISFFFLSNLPPHTHTNTYMVARERN